ncbi:uncharacterized protein LOC129761607 [Toxorhynchites rutilus septentrionalis]|uniref:uncharacterized protein LOC129761607 n=1 Tax=Toxorhynchites rutilus septentrionalis TaxID=329112 RepID=UPI002479AFD4|nr:uncharacterized protein LOC129761607 [Toxorhynchites rutilus septentrionalis]
MVGRGSKEKTVSLPRTVTVDGDELEVVDEFKYLGSLITTDNNITKEIQRRIQAGSRAYFALRKTLRSRRIRCCTKLTVYKTLMRPVVLYGLETVTLLTEDIRALAVFERKVLRTIFGGVQTESGEWRRCMNHELQALLGEIPIVHLAKVGRLRWAGHVARIPDDSAVKSVLFNDPAGTRNRGAQRARWLDQIEADLRVTGRLRNWRRVAQDRVDWRRIIETARATAALN